MRKNAWGCTRQPPGGSKKMHQAAAGKQKLNYYRIGEPHVIIRFMAKSDEKGVHRYEDH